VNRDHLLEGIERLVEEYAPAAWEDEDLNYIANAIVRRYYTKMLQGKVCIDLPALPGKVKRIPLRGQYGVGRFALVDECDYERLICMPWYGRADGYVTTPVVYIDPATGRRKHTSIQLQRAVLNPPRYRFVDHIDGNTLNNVRSNLRLASPLESSRNRGLQSNNTSGFKGAYLNRASGRWQARISVEGKLISLGSYASKEEAARAYSQAADKYYGKFVRRH